MMLNNSLSLVISLISSITLSLKRRIPQIQLGLFHTMTLWITPRSWQWGPVENKTLRQKWWLVNFPCICNNIPAAPAYGVHIYQLIRYTRACGSFRGFHDRRLQLIMKLLKQGFLVVKLKSSLRKFYVRHHDLVNHYGVAVSQMTTEIFCLS